MPGKNFIGPRLFCALCRTRCLIQVDPIVHEWNADGVVICQDLSCGYKATVAVNYRLGTGAQMRSERQPVTLAKGEFRDRLALHCPECQATPDIRSSNDRSPLVRMVYFTCGQCGYRGRADVCHLELLSIPGKGIFTGIPMHPELRAAWIAELGIDPERWRKHEYDGTKTRNARLAGAARAGH